MALENDKILPHVTVSVYQRPAQVENINHPAHATVFANQNTVVHAANKILSHASVSVYIHTVALAPYPNTLPYPVTKKTRTLSLLQGYTLSIYCSYPVCSIINKSNCFLLLQKRVYF